MASREPGSIKCTELKLYDRLEAFDWESNEYVTHESLFLLQRLRHLGYGTMPNSHEGLVECQKVFDIALDTGCAVGSLAITPAVALS